MIQKAFSLKVYFTLRIIKISPSPPPHPTAQYVVHYTKRIETNREDDSGMRSVKG
jgi:hypothetical protein